MEVSGWKSILLDYDRSATEFVGDDVDKYSHLCDLGGIYEKVLLFIPTIDNGTVTLHIQRNNSIATVPVPLNILDADATGHFASATTAGTGGIAVIFEIGGAEAFRVYTGANQTADRTFYARGFNS